MAEGMQNTSSVGTRRFDKDLNEDINDFHLPDNSWTHARNAINNSRTGDLGKIGNEPSNLLCGNAPFTIIGTVHIYADVWAIFSTDNTNSAIGIYDESDCSYFPVINESTCLKFNKDYLIKGASRPTSDCYYRIYWDDGLNPTRIITLDIDNLDNNLYTSPNSPIHWIQDCNLVNGCNICTNTPDLDCDLLRLARYIDAPCVKVSKGVTGGTLLNGSYAVAIAYSIGGQKMSDWYISNIQPLFEHSNVASSLEVTLSNLDESFDEYNLAIISIINQQTTCSTPGTYSTRQTNIVFDGISNQWATIPLEQIPILTPIVEKTDALFDVNDYLIRVGPTSKEDFNYQPLANQIVAKWQSVEYDAKYYRNGGNNTNYMRDEIYSFFIRWIYDTGDKSACYHIPGRPPVKIGTAQGTGDLQYTTTDALSGESSFAFNWYVNNTAFQTATPGTALPDGGVVIAEGLMGYWESTEKYSDDKPQIWNSVTNPIAGFNTTTSPYTSLATYAQYSGSAINISDLDLCGKPIRHHKFPDMYLEGSSSNSTRYLNDISNRIRIMGVKFENIKRPLMNDGITPVPGIVGYEILRGNRAAQKTILAKGILNNVRSYLVRSATGNITTIGLYPNYPYNDLREDQFLSQNIVTPTNCLFNNSSATFATDNSTPHSANPETSNLFTFHSPDTNFYEPFLSATELKIHGEINGDVTGRFTKSERHPKHKIISNLAFVISAIGGIGAAAVKLKGKRTFGFNEPYRPGFSISSVGNPVINSPSLAFPPLYSVPGTYLTLLNAPRIAYLNSLTTSLTTAALAGRNPDDAGGSIATYFRAYMLLARAIQGLNTQTRNWQVEKSDLNEVPKPLRLVYSLPIFFNAVLEGTDNVLNFIRAFSRYRDFALRYHSHCLYNRYLRPTSGNKRKKIGNQFYLSNQVSSQLPGFTINNLYRNKSVFLALDNNTVTNPIIKDITRIRCTDVEDLLERASPINSTKIPKDPTQSNFNPYSDYASTFGFPERLSNQVQLNINYGIPVGIHRGVQVASSHYASLKNRIRNQYGQIGSIQILPASYCSYPAPSLTERAATGTIFGGDTYLGRYTEKNTFFYFYDWLYDQPDGFQYDYTKYNMISYPRFWANFTEFETQDFVGSFFPALASIFSQGSTGFSNTLVTPSDFYNLDGTYCTGSSLGASFFNSSNIRLTVRYAWFYLFSSGVRDFYVESDLNIDLRDWNEPIYEQHYDPYRFTDTYSMFATDIIKKPNFYKYDASLSISRLSISQTAWGSVQQINYDPYVAETCLTYQPSRVIYSLPVQSENVADAWVVYLANNYYDFNNVPTCIKAINKSGAIIFFDSASPEMFQGLDQLQTDLGTKLTIGDGGLFSQPPQKIVNADMPYEYASCQSRLSVINTPAGVYWVSQNQGKVFNYLGGLKEISNAQMKWWFINYLPYRLTESFPNFELLDNPVNGVGCQAIYDNQNSLIYFTKKDYSLRTDLPPGTELLYTGSNKFIVRVNNQNQNTIELGNPNYFIDCSWTISYDPKIGSWISYHDWHPNLLMPGKNTFLSIVNNQIYLHNWLCDSYCNFYGVDYPFEIEYMVDTAQQVNTIRSVEYQMEAYVYGDNCFDRFNVLDFNFDEAVVYNLEQVSGLLRLNLTPRNNPQLLVSYPIVDTIVGIIDILYSKVENKYRFNQFWDITADRGQGASPSQQLIWNTANNGYVRTLNQNNLNYTKDVFQRKKFRHYTNTVFLRKNVSGNKKILVLLTNNKNLNSPR